MAQIIRKNQIKLKTSLCLVFGLLPGLLHAGCVFPDNLTETASIRTVSAGVTKLLALADWAESESNGCSSQSELQTAYAKAQNAVFVRTQIVRLNGEIANVERAQVSAGVTWLSDSRQAVLSNKENSLRVFENLESQLSSLISFAPGQLVSGRIWSGQPIGSSLMRIEGMPQVNRKSSGSMFELQQSTNQGRPISFDVGLLIRQLRSPPARTTFSPSSSSNSEIQQLNQALRFSNLIPSHFDLSSRFDRPESQILTDGFKTYACAGFALSSALEFMFDQFPRAPLTPRFQVSPWHTYSLMQSTLAPEDDCSNVHSIASELRSGTHVYDGVDSLSSAIGLFSSPRRCAFLSRRNAIQISKFVSIVNRKVLHSDLLRHIVYREKPVLVVIRSEARIGEDQGDWYNIVGGRMRHALLVVGYGEGLSPMTLSRRPYFIVRDSMATQPIHYKVDADQLAFFLDEAHVILDASINWF